ncbi:urokinase plasminogen activator surface receptor-like, partial [Clarias magur]
MKSQVTLLLICMLFSKALSLTCMQLIPRINSPEEITCADQCLTSTIYTSDGSVPAELVKTCGTPETCVRGIINLGVHKMFTNTKCCKTDNCNTESLPDCVFISFFYCKNLPIPARGKKNLP